MPKGGGGGRSGSRGRSSNFGDDDGGGIDPSEAIEQATQGGMKYLMYGVVAIVVIGMIMIGFNSWQSGSTRRKYMEMAAQTRIRLGEATEETTRFFNMTKRQLGLAQEKTKKTLGMEELRNANERDELQFDFLRDKEETKREMQQLSFDNMEDQRARTLAGPT